MMQNEIVNPLLVRKYNQPVPRYTSYPTVPYWQEVIDRENWENSFRKRFSEENHVHGISLYIHLPFCESLCTYCGCNKKITTNHSVEEVYLSAIEKEWTLYRKLMNQAPVIRELHIGGGTPTFFSPRNLDRLFTAIFKHSIIHPKHEFSIEGHPNNTTVQHLKVLYNAGFRRISYGVQDNDPDVQRIINRIQPFENVKYATEKARETGFQSVNFDLIYGLPLQTTETVRNTINKVSGLMPDRIAYYSYAHVPWASKGQRLFDESNLPSAEEKLALYIEGKNLLLHHGYADIGMDHFALPADDLYKAWDKGKLHRNFMGYTTQNTGILLGLGVSSISDTGNAYAQNEKALHDYYEQINKGILAVRKGYFLSNEDRSFKKYILDISCKGQTEFKPADKEILEGFVFPKLEGLQTDKLIQFSEAGLQLTPQGHYFIRNICSAFDLYLDGTKNERALFSKSI
ncbi:MAG: oxygen-independent coproporphyrinogen III oxidase [Bacteroidetes bacterium]|nr:oxygen-independent coproporphyrinogen III oxidase [Bacteroidota bacterium]